MPLFGTLDVDGRAAAAPTMDTLDTDTLLLERVEVLQVLYELDSAHSQDLLPPALHPTVPPTLTVVAWRCRSGPLGPFTLVQARVGCRAGVRPRGFLLSAVIDAPDVGSALAARWGFRCEVGEASLRPYHDRIDVTVARDGAPVLAASLVDPQPISGGDLQYVASMHLARTPAGMKLVQVDPEYTFHRADRGLPRLDAFDAGAWGDDRVVPVFPVTASFAVADIALPQIRYVTSPDVAAIQGTEKIR